MTLTTLGSLGIHLKTSKRNVNDGINKKKPVKV